MSVTSTQAPIAHAQTSPNAGKRSSTQWMISREVDCFLILFTPLMAAPAVLLLSSSSVGVKAATISLIVASFFALGHHLPGLIRAYGDPGLFRRFRWRFLLAPPLVFLAYFPLYQYHFPLYRLIILVWATWHALMQLYGFVRIYDAKAGVTSPQTARWDWLLCLCGFVTPRFLHPQQLSETLGYWYSTGGPVISASLINGVRLVCLVFTVVVVVGYAVNYAIQWQRGPKPNPLKVVMLVSGIGTWWFAMCFVEELILGIALFDICHDVQYNAIVWMYNRRLATSGAKLGSFMKYLFGRGMVLLYLGLITAYGALGLVAPLVQDGTVSRVFYGLIFTSTILHYYYDGFIWKVREQGNQKNLGLRQAGGLRSVREAMVGRYAHAIKWCPVVLVLGVLFVSDWVDPPLTTARKQDIERRYMSGLLGRPLLPRGAEESSWLQTRYDATRRIAEVVPGDRRIQLKAAIAMANFGENDEAIGKLNGLLMQHPDYRDAHVALADIHFYHGSYDQAAPLYERALLQSVHGVDRARVNLRLRVIDLENGDEDGAARRLKEAQEDAPDLAASVVSADMMHSESSSPAVRSAYP